MNPVAPIPDPSDSNYAHQNFIAGQDAEHLNLLSIFYYVMAGLTALGGLGFAFQIFMGLIIAGSTVAPGATVTVTPNTFPGAPVMPPPPLGSPTSFGWMFVAIGVIGLLCVEALAAVTFIAGRSLARREKKTLIQVVAALLCLHVPLGTALGVFTFIVLSRPSVMALFEEPRSA